jgi:superfamily II RNA helicase
VLEFPFPLDPFQLDALHSLDSGRSVVVCAPTGSGKTVIGEHAIRLALDRGERVFYTTPLKALSNQKFRDFSSALGEAHVGLLTGDISIRPDAPVVVMTTEVFRNMLYGGAPAEPRLRSLRFVVLDECHYINDAGRGTVWEESIIRCPRGIQLVALSATIANAEELAAWMTRAHGPTDLVAEDRRPVPLRVHFFRRGRLTPLLTRDGKPAPGVGQSRGGRLSARPESTPHPTRVIERLREGDMLPAIYFIFSRRGCEYAIERSAHLSLLIPDEIDRMEAILDPLIAANPFVRRHPHLHYLARGLAVHHAGLLPAWKSVVERLFQAGLIKVVFATETLAAGINMPARTTVISALTKRGDEGYRTLTASEFLQMSGRAGRRGMDPVGHVVVLPDPYRSMEEAARLAASPPNPLLSRFTPTYGLVLGLLRTHTPEEAENLLRQSFGQFQAERRAIASDERRKGKARRRETRRGIVRQSIDLSHAATQEAAGRIVPRGGRDADTSQTLRSIYWSAFKALQRVLEEFGYVKGDTPTERGLTAAAFRVENELMVAEALRALAWERLDPADLAAVATALATEDLRPGIWVNGRISLSTRTALVEVRRAVSRVARAQRRRGIDVPARLCEVASSLTQMWAEGAAWVDITKATDMDEGTIVQIMRRTLDLLRQIPEAPGLPEALATMALTAARAIDRPPVSDVL